MISEIIAQERKNLFDVSPSLLIEGPCRVGEGILNLLDTHLHFYESKFKAAQKEVCVFIPASGSGSRMFEFIHEFLQNPNDENRASVERFFSHISKFAFFELLPLEIQNNILNFEMDWMDFLNFLMAPEGQDYAQLPKGVFPFHSYASGVKNPIEEHIFQASFLNASKATFHFTIQEKYEDLIKMVIANAEQNDQKNYEVAYSYQSNTADAYVFNEQQEALKDLDGNYLRRPAGHGALLPNLQSIQADLIFVKNIDNVQHLSHASSSNQVWSALAGLLIEIRERLQLIQTSKSIPELIKLNEEFQLYTHSEISSIKDEVNLISIINRPLRICGMVKNEGLAGGGPFMINRDGIVTKQIIEKSQIVNEDQTKHLFSSTHFNPVMMVLCTKDLEGNEIDLSQLVDAKSSFKVKKTYLGNQINYLELPGLWNGSMYYWNSIFVEIPSNTFSPVKSVMDLLNPLHQEVNH